MATLSDGLLSIHGALRSANIALEEARGIIAGEIPRPPGTHDKILAVRKDVCDAMGLADDLRRSPTERTEIQKTLDAALKVVGEQAAKLDDRGNVIDALVVLAVESNKITQHFKAKAAAAESQLAQERQESLDAVEELGKVLGYLRR